MWNCPHCELYYDLDKHINTCKSNNHFKKHCNTCLKFFVGCDDSKYSCYAAKKKISCYHARKRLNYQRLICVPPLEYKCPVTSCNKIFAQRWSRKRHIKKQHDNIKYVADDGGYKYNKNKTDLKKLNRELL